MKNALLMQFFRWLLVLIIPLLLIIGSITILTTPEYLSLEYAKPGFPMDPFGFTTQERLEHASDNLRFLRQGLPKTFLEQQNHQGQPLYNAREISHMVDVQSVFQATWNAGRFLLVLALFLTTAITWREENRSLFFSSIRQAGLLSAGFTTVVALLAVLSWNAWFTTFHQFFFQPGTWTFETTDTLIRLFPMPFWFDGALTVSGLTLSAGILLAVLGRFLTKRAAVTAQIEK